MKGPQNSFYGAEIAFGRAVEVDETVVRTSRGLPFLSRGPLADRFYPSVSNGSHERSDRHERSEVGPRGHGYGRAATGTDARAAVDRRGNFTTMSETGSNACKIDRVIERRGLDGLDEELGRRRRADDASLRELESVFNRRVLAAALRDERVETIQGEVANLYRLLTAEEVSAGARTEAIDRLERNGIDAEALQEDFVSYQTVRTHLRDCLGLETGRESSIDRTDAEDTVFSFLARSETVIEQTLSRLQSADELHAGELDLSVNARVACRDCGREYTVSQLLDRGSCACYRDDSQ